MKRDLFGRYVWLVDTIRREKRISFEEIAKRWDEQPGSKGAFLALRTFHNHRRAIYELFGLRIVCDRANSNRYYIAGAESDPTVQLKIWMLQRLCYGDADRCTRRIAERVILDSTPEEKFGLNLIIDAMEEGTVLKTVYSMPISDSKSTILVAPYCVRYWHSQWFLVGKDIDTGRIHSFNLNRMISIVPIDMRFVYPADFSPRDYFRNTFGMEIDAERTPERICLKVGGSTRHKFRSCPLHESQREVESLGDYSVFEYFLAAGPEFFRAVLAYGDDIEVLSPSTLREEVGRKVLDLASRYSMPAAE